MTTLANGVRVITEAMPHVRSVSVGVWIGSGSRREIGRAERHLALHRAHAVQGHHAAAPRKTSPARWIPSAATWTPSPPRNWSASTPRCWTSTSRRRSTFWPTWCSIRCSATRTSKRKRASFWKRSRWRRTARTTWSTRSSPPTSGKTIRWASRFWGRRETVKRFDRAMMQRYYGAIYAPANLIVTAAGNLTHERLVALVREHFEASAAGEPLPAGPGSRHARAHRAAQQEGAGAGAPVPGRAVVSAAARGALRLLRAEHAAGRRHEFAAVPEHSRAAGAGVRRVLAS